MDVLGFDQSNFTQSLTIDSVMTSLGDVVFIFDEQTRYIKIWADDEAKLFLPKKDLLGKTLIEALGKEKATPFVELYKKARELNLPQEIEYSGQPFNDSWFHGRLSPIQGVDGRHYYSFVIRDITESRRLREALNASQAAQVNSAQLAALGEMAGGIAHEINNPLTIIQTRVVQIEQMLSDFVKNSDKIREGLHRIDLTTERISKIVKGLKAFARNADQDPFMPTDLVEVLDEILSLSKTRFRNHGIEIRFRYHRRMVIECRSVQIGQVFLNILNNAFDAVENLDQKWVEISMMEIPGFVQITFQDSGTGIPQPYRSKIMDPFFTTKEVGKGTGLGLSISRGIIEQHGGQFKLDEASRHTTFQILLPKSQSH